MPALMLNGVNYSGVGGGGNANEQVLTWAEYCALTPEEKMNDTTYYINDINGNGQSFRPVIFSLEEREIGVWTDGKPLYQKTIIYENSISGSVQIQHGISDIESVISIVGTCRDSYDNNLRIYTVSDLRQDGNNIYLNGVYNTYVEVYVPDVFSTRIINMIITLRYTKTTDQPGSGTWTPQGVPAVHYSTEERVIGTWVDGSTVYERSISLGSFSVNNGGNHTIESSTNINLFTDYEGYVLENNISYALPDPSIRIKLDSSRNLIFQGVGGSWNVSNGYLTVRYTKSS